MSEAGGNLDKLIGELRPRLHRYCARMTGSVIDAEDVVQDALAKAIEAYPMAGEVHRMDSWLFRIAHNAALDFLRRRSRQDAIRIDEDMELMADPNNTSAAREAAAVSLGTFMRLTVAERSSVILMDVLGYTISEIGTILDSTVPAVKAALHRGRMRLRQFAAEPLDRAVPVLPDGERARLAYYVDRFNARDFDAIRDRLADEVRLELVNRLRLTGKKEVANYFHNYSEAQFWHLSFGLVDRRPALLVHDADDLESQPKYFVLLEWSGDRVVGIRDFIFARYAIEDAEVIVLS